jgi:Organic solute transporter Ostalpha
VIWSGVFQYCFIRVFMTCVAVATQAFGRYCQTSLNPVFAHVWVMGIEAAAVTVAMYCIIQFYVQLKDDIREHKPLLKVAAIKLVIFLSFWQTLAISLLTGTGAIKPSNQIQAPDIKIGIPAMLLDIEMAIFAIFHLWAFSWKPYTLRSKQNLAESVPGHDLARTDYKGGFLGVKAIIEAFNPWDLVKAVGRAARWTFVGRKSRTQDVSYQLRNTSTGHKHGLHRPHESNQSSIYPPTTGYQSSSDLVGAAGARPYASSELTEGQELLPNAQGNPMSRPGLQRDGSSSSGVDGSTGQYSRTSSDIGVAKSIYEGDEDDGDEPVRSGELPVQPLPPREYRYHGGYGGGQQQDIGVVRVAHPERDRVRSREEGFVSDTRL